MYAGAPQFAMVFLGFCCENFHVFKFQPTFPHFVFGTQTQQSNNNLYSALEQAYKYCRYLSGVTLFRLPINWKMNFANISFPQKKIKLSSLKHSQLFRKKHIPNFIFVLLLLVSLRKQSTTFFFFIQFWQVICSYTFVLS